MLGKLSKRCPISASVTSSNPIKAAKQWSSLRLSLLKKNSAQQVLPETSVAFILHSGWSLKRTVSRTRPVSVLGWPLALLLLHLVRWGNGKGEDFDDGDVQDELTVPQKVSTELKRAIEVGLVLVVQLPLLQLLPAIT